jgi:hypothetical protein
MARIYATSITDLATGQRRLYEEAHNLILVGGTDTGNTPLPTAMGVVAIYKWYPPYFGNNSWKQVASRQNFRY